MSYLFTESLLPIGCSRELRPFLRRSSSSVSDCRMLVCLLKRRLAVRRLVALRARCQDRRCETVPMRRLDYAAESKTSLLNSRRIVSVSLQQTVVAYRANTCNIGSPVCDEHKHHTVALIPHMHNSVLSDAHVDRLRSGACVRCVLFGIVGHGLVGGNRRRWIWRTHRPFTR